MHDHIHSILTKYLLACRDIATVCVKKCKLHVPSSAGHETNCCMCIYTCKADNSYPVRYLCITCISRIVVSMCVYLVLLHTSARKCILFGDIVGGLG